METRHPTSWVSLIIAILIFSLDLEAVKEAILEALIYSPGDVLRVAIDNRVEDSQIQLSRKWDNSE